LLEEESALIVGSFRVAAKRGVVGNRRWVGRREGRVFVDGESVKATANLGRVPVAGKAAVRSRSCRSVNEVAAIADAIILQARVEITVAFAKGNAGLNSHVSGGGWVLERKRVGTALGDIASGVVECSEPRRARRGNLVTVLIKNSQSGGGEGQSGQGHGDEVQIHVGAVD
jgi:hypothetical protein